MDRDAIQKTIIKKLSKRSRLLKKAIKPGETKVYKLNFRPIRGERSSDEETGENAYLRANRRANSRYDYQECIDCQRINGLYVYRPFYVNDYLDNFYNQLESTYYNNREDTYYVEHVGDVALLFKRLNLYQGLEYSYILNPTLGVYLFRFLVDMVYLLRIPENAINNFYLNSKMVVVRYDDKRNMHRQTDDNIRRSPGPVIIMPLGPDIGVYDLIAVNNPTNALRIFLKKGSILAIDTVAKRTWAFGTPNDFVNQSSQYRYEIMLYPYVFGTGYDFNYYY